MYISIPKKITFICGFTKNEWSADTFTKIQHVLRCKNYDIGTIRVPLWIGNSTFWNCNPLNLNFLKLHPSPVKIKTFPKISLNLCFLYDSFQLITFQPDDVNLWHFKLILFYLSKFIAWNIMVCVLQRYRDYL